ncbi:PAS domain S-box-containing protein [Roseimarinus sediminis]
MISFFVAFLSLQRRKAKGAFELHFLMLVTALWSLAAMFESAAILEHQKIFWSKIEYIFAPTVPIMYLLFVLSFTRKEKYIKPRNILLLLIVPLITTTLAFTNEMHHLIWTDFSSISEQTNLMLYSHGPWFLTGYTAYSYLIFLVATYILYSFVVKFSQLFRWQAIAVFFGGLFPWTASILYVSGLNPVPGLNITPLSIIFTGVVMASVILYSRLLSLAPIARDMLVENLDDGILVLDHQKRIQDINRAAMEILGVRSRNVIGLPIEFTDISLHPLYRYINDNKNIENVKVEIFDKQFWYSVFVHDIKRKQESKLYIIRNITTNVQMELDLAKSEEYHRTLIKSVPDMLFVVDRKGFIVDYKAEINDLYTSPENFMGKEFKTVLPPEVVIMFDKAIEKTQNSNEVSELNYQLPINNEMHYYHARIIAFAKDKLVCMVRNTTKQTIAEQNLRESEENFRSFFETIDDIIIIGTTEGAVLFSNPAVEQKLGYNFDELKERGMLGVVSPGMMDQAMVGFKEILEDKRNFCSLPLQRKDGSLIPVETRIWKGTWNGQPCIFRISKDLSKEQEALLKFNKLFENNPALMAVSKLPENIFLDVNKAFISASGYSKEEIIGKTAKDLGLFFDSDDYKQAVNAYRHSGKLDKLEVQIRTKKGEVLTGLLSGETIESQGEILLLTVLTDISKQKEAEVNLLLAKHAAEMANKAKSEFLANMSHEIRTPMNSILGFSEIMLNSTDDPKHREFLNTILSSGNTLLSLINDILDLSKVEAGRLEIKPEYTSLKITVNEIKQLFELKARKQQIDLLVKFDVEMPTTVLIDEVRLRQILLNIVGNAVKFTKEGHVSIEVTLLNKKYDTVFFEIGIEDTGIGIPAHDLGRIFDAFSQQSGHDNRTYGGTGLGLAICKRLMELMGGEIKVESKVGRGSRFILYFNNIPFVADRVSKQESYVWDVNEMNFAPAKILIVDDVEHNRFLVKAYLSRYSFELLEAENGKIAIDMVRKLNPDLVLMDVRMPVMDGFEATKILKSDPKTRSIPVIALTASTLQNEVDAIKYIFDEFMHKPVKKNEIIAMLKKFLQFSDNAELKNNKQSQVALDDPEPTVSTTKVDSKIIEIFSALFAVEIAEQKLFMLFDNLSDMANRIHQFASENQVAELERTAKTLKKYIDAFDFENVQNCLNEIEANFCS